MNNAAAAAFLRATAIVFLPREGADALIVGRVYSDHVVIDYVRIDEREVAFPVYGLGDPRPASYLKDGDYRIAANALERTAKDRALGKRDSEDLDAAENLEIARATAEVMP